MNNAEIIRSMTLTEKIGQLVVVGLEGPVLDDTALALLADYHVGGFAFFRRNIESVEQTRALVQSLKTANRANKVPLFLAIDEEGGRVSRMPQEFDKLPAGKAIGAAGDKDLAFQMGRILGARVKALGLNMNFAPVLDINSNPANPVIGDRSLGDTAEIVTTLGLQVMEGIRAEGVISVVKHFPGHGDTAVDSHIGLPRVDADLDRLEGFELVPFREAVRLQPDAIMTAHILLPKLDPENPATLSPPIITDLLRRRMNFWGAVITDDLTMGAIREHYDLGTAAVGAVQAGADIVLVCHGYANYVTVLSRLKAAAEDGTLPQARIDEALGRVLDLKCKYGLTDEDGAALKPEELNLISRRLMDWLDRFNIH